MRKNVPSEPLLAGNKKEDGSGDKDGTQHAVKPACLLPSDILDYKLGVLGSEEPFPVQQGGKQGNSACQGKDALYEIVAHGGA